jgi:hypothetical protein
LDAEIAFFIEIGVGDAVAENRRILDKSQLRATVIADEPGSPSSDLGVGPFDYARARLRRARRLQCDSR